jgi:hypothetical protein
MRNAGDNSEISRATATVNVSATAPPVSIWRITSLEITGMSGAIPHDSLNRFGLVTYYQYFSHRDRLAFIMAGHEAYIHYHNGVDLIPDQHDLDFDGNFAELISWPEEAWIQPAGLSFPGLGGERGHFPWLPSISLARNEGWTATDFPPLPSISYSGDLSIGGLSGRAFIEATITTGSPIVSANSVADVVAGKNGTTISGTVTFTYRAYLGSMLDKTWAVTYSFTGERL